MKENVPCLKSLSVKDKLRTFDFPRPQLKLNRDRPI